MALPQNPPVTVRQFGHEKEPVVVIDGFSGMAEELRAQALGAEYRDGGAHDPGISAWAEPAYLDRRRELMFAIMQRVFGFRRGIQMEVSTFSLVTTPPEDLSPAQRNPHFDDTGSDVIGIMHYLLDQESGGTAFYRHRRTRFEAITPERAARYREALEEDEAEFGPVPARYHYGNSERYELIGEVEAKPDRLIIYRGRLLHSGKIPSAENLSGDPAKGRLTINMFLRGR